MSRSTTAYSIPVEMRDSVKALSTVTMIPASRLVEVALANWLPARLRALSKGERAAFEEALKQRSA